MDQYQNPNLEVKNPSEFSVPNTDLSQGLGNFPTSTTEEEKEPVTSQQEVNIEERIQPSEISESFTPDTTPTEEEGGKEYLRLLDLITDAEDTMEELKKGISALKDKKVDNEELSTDEDPRIVVQKLTQEISNEETFPNLEQVFDSYKQQLNEDPLAPLPKELSPTGEFFPNSNVLDLSHLPTSLDPRVEINQGTKKKEIIFPFPANTSQDPQYSATFEGQTSFDYEDFVKALQQGIQPPNEGVYIKLEQENDYKIIRLNHFQFDEINNAILREEESRDQTQPPVTPSTQSYEQPPTREPEGFPPPQPLGV